MVYYQRVEQQTDDHDNMEGDRFGVPEHLQKVILMHYHDKTGARHMGMNKTSKRVGSRHTSYKR